LENTRLKRAIKQLEAINAIIDICIDRELYDRLFDDSILHFSEDARKSLSALDHPNVGLETRAQERIDSIRATVSQLPDSHPVLSISVPALPYISSASVSLEDKMFQDWSILFWIKSLRAILQKKSRIPWINIFDDLIALLETNLPRSNVALEQEQQTIRTKLLFAFLMELSAVARAEASYGYAERARALIPYIGGFKQNERYEYGTNYDRWIWYNMGLSYQHSGLQHKAVLEFNRVISKFWNWVSKEKKSLHDEGVSIEFLFLVLPSIIQRATISLQLQLGYHALQTLSFENSYYTDKTGNWIRKLSGLHKGQDTLMQGAMRHLTRQQETFQIEALLQLERISTPPFAERTYFCRKMMSLWKKTFDQQWTEYQTELPAFSEKGPERLGSHIKTIEQAVAWFLEKTRELDKDIQTFTDDNEKTNILAFSARFEPSIARLTQRIESAREVYWKWVEGNSFDERVYFSRWGQLLAASVRILQKILDFYLYQGVSAAPILVHTLTEAILDFYLSKSDYVPTVRNDRQNRPKALELEDFRSDDLPDLVTGLTLFYETMAAILVKKKWDKIHISDSVKRRIGGSAGKILRDSHFRFLDALDEYDREFSENRQIRFLDRCNERLKWFSGNKVQGKSCQDCLSPSSRRSKKVLHPYVFKELLLCPTVKNSKGTKCLNENRDQDRLNNNNYRQIMENAENDFTQHFKGKSAHPPRQPALHFVGLQRWNSLTPAQGKSVGGGYFIYHKGQDGKIDLGVAIDPGFDFVRNFFRMGFSLVDIDIVIISHAHADHLWDFESIVQLLNEMSDKTGQSSRIDVILTLGVYTRFKHVINNSTLRRFINPLVVDIRKEINPRFLDHTFQFVKVDDVREMPWTIILPGIDDINKGKYPELSIRATRAYHEDYSEESDSFGFILTYKEGNGAAASTEISFGYTGDTKWVGNDLYNRGCPYNKQKDVCAKSAICNHEMWVTVADQYTECDVILTHIGSLIKHKDRKGNPGKRFNSYSRSEQCEELIRKENHPYLFGMIRLLKELRHSKKNEAESKEKLVLLGEFGEELRGGIRDDIVDRFRKGVLDDWPILPVDVGLDLWLRKESKSGGMTHAKHTALCVICEQYRPVEEMKLHRFGHDEAIFYFCETCFKSIPENVRNAKLQRIYEVGWELRHSV